MSTRAFGRLRRFVDDALLFLKCFVALDQQLERCIRIACLRAAR
jgi:hypothetical protein